MERNISPLDDKKDLFLVKRRKMSIKFPCLDDALDDPNGLLAIGGDLSEKRLISAYQQGIFPWVNHGQPILWWSPNPRCVLLPNTIHVSRSLKKKINSNIFHITYNKEFKNVIHECSINRKDDDTWLTSSMQDAYIRLHEIGYAHSIECWAHEKLVGGLYGIAMGKVFFGESMYSRVSDASKIILASLMDRLALMDFQLLDCQVESNHLKSLGARLIPREKFSCVLKKYCNLTKSIFP